MISGDDFTVSVVISTYNGSKYIKPLLDSIRFQSLIVDEVIICDDCSTDCTVAIIEEYISKYCLNSWKLFVGEKNVGWKKNFRKAIDLSSSDYIFLCDQDDIWDADKVKDMSLIMHENPNIECLACNYIPFFENNVKTDERYHVKGIKKNDLSVKRVKLKKYYFSCMRPGCTFCIKRELWNLVRKVDDVSIPHDDVFWSASISRNSLYIYNKPLISFRRHGDNASTPDATKSLNRRITAIDELILISRWILKNYNTISCISNEKYIKKYLLFLEKRKNILCSKRILKMMLFCFKYFKYYPTLRNLLADLYYIFKGCR